MHTTNSITSSVRWEPVEICVRLWESTISLCGYSSPRRASELQGRLLVFHLISLCNARLSVHQIKCYY